MELIGTVSDDNIVCIFKYTINCLPDNITEWHPDGEKGASAEDIMTDIEKNACPGAGACGGMYTG